MTQHGRIYAGYDVNKPSELVELLKQKRVQKYLELSDEQKSACVELFSKTKEISRELNRNGLTGAEHFYRHSTATKELATRYLDEVLAPAQLVRLKNFAYRAEIDTIGWADSISGGRLSDAVGVYDSQRHSLHQRTSAIVAAHELQILEIKKRMEIAVLNELSAEQRKNAKDALGEFCDFTLEDRGDWMRDAAAKYNERKNALKSK